MKSMIVTITCLICALVLVFISTLAQIDTDVHIVERTMLRSFIVWWHGFPVFPGGATIAFILLFNLGINFAKRRFWKKKTLVLIHFGFALLITSEALRMMAAHESFVVLRKGETVNYSESATERELALIDRSSKNTPHVTSVDLTRGYKTYTPFQSPLCVTIDEDSYYVEGFGRWPLMNGTRKFGSCEISIRPKRTYYPYGITLSEFNYEIHPGSNIPKSFSSKISIEDKEGNLIRNAEISMNNPLKFGDITYYQENYADEGHTSVLHVVENPWKHLPYLSLMIIAVGLSLNFIKVIRRRG